MKYKAIFLDVDDTLIGDDKIISQGNLQAIRRAQEKGAYVSIATGRGYKGCTGIWSALGIEGPIIVYGGACIKDTQTGETLFSAEIDANLITEALEYARALGIPCQIYQGDTVIVEQINPTSQSYAQKLGLDLLEEKDIRTKQWENIPKILAFAPPGQEAEMIGKFQQHFSGRLEVATSKPGFIELNRYGCNKGTTLLQLAQRMGYAMEEIIAVGDNTLDYQMIQMAGLGVCVGNGQQVVKDIADVIAPSCADDGVKWVIEEYILQN